MSKEEYKKIKVELKLVNGGTLGTVSVVSDLEFKQEIVEGIVEETIRQSTIHLIDKLFILGAEKALELENRK